MNQDDFDAVDWACVVMVIVAAAAVAFQRVRNQ